MATLTVPSRPKRLRSSRVRLRALDPLARRFRGRRAWRRHAAGLPVSLIGERCALPARIVDVSLGGARVEIDWQSLPSGHIRDADPVIRLFGEAFCGRVVLHSNSPRFALEGAVVRLIIDTALAWKVQVGVHFEGLLPRDLQWIFGRALSSTAQLHMRARPVRSPVRPRTEREARAWLAQRPWARRLRRRSRFALGRR